MDTVPGHGCNDTDNGWNGWNDVALRQLLEGGGKLK